MFLFCFRRQDKWLPAFPKGKGDSTGVCGAMVSTGGPTQLTARTRLGARTGKYRLSFAHHVPKGITCAGRMGVRSRITQKKSASCVWWTKNNNLMLIKGAIAGRRGSLVEIISR